MRTSPFVVGALLASTLSSFAQDAFVPQCDLPYSQIAKKNPIDKSCPPEGTPDSPNHAKEYQAKNNLCAPEPSINVTLADVIAMQKDVENDTRIPIGQRDTPVPDRSVLRNIHTMSNGRKIGEGDRIRLVAFVTGAKATGTTSRPDGTAGEGVNCRHLGAAINDIHIDIGSSPTTKACDGIVVEMIPHFRPAVWTPANLHKLRSRPVRVTGHLFLDSRHNLSTCSNPSTRGDPPRISLWEVHPVYAVDVCKSADLSECAISNDGRWVPFDRWLASPAAKGAKRLAKKPARQHLKTE
jgi:hypothetical protein